MTLIPTLREVPADAEITSHQLLLRAGFIRQNASGVYSYLPLGRKVLRKIEGIIREEMEDAGAMELLLPALQQAELWQESGRWQTYGPELMRLHDRHGREFALGATHEEVITSIIRDEVKSYKKLPLTLFQIQNKFRDEKRPRFGLLRGREFLMKDAYSFHGSAESLDIVYERMFQAYCNIFERCGLDYRAVIADSGAMGGKDTHEFMVLSEVGEDTIAYSDSSNYAANVEMAPVIMTYEISNEQPKERMKIHTPDVKTIQAVSTFLHIKETKCIKSLLFNVDEEFVLVLARGDHEINDIKVKNALGASVVELASAEDTKKVMGCSVGSIGAVNVSNLKVIADTAVQNIVNGVCGANEEGYHYTNVQPEQDLNIDQYADLRFIQEGDPSPDGEGIIKFAKGIEVGHLFKLGTRYSEAMKANILDENGRSQAVLMGCYGIGVSRTLAAVAEQFNDEKGLLWPANLAPYQIHVIPINYKNEDQKTVANQLYAELKGSRLDVLMDDRQERPGVKFADSDLLGIPLRVTVGKRASEGIVEVKVRETGEALEVHTNELMSALSKLI